MGKIGIFLSVAAFWASGLVIGQDNLQKSISRGNEIYANDCLHCHLEEGQGIPGVFPPLAQSDYLVEDLGRTIRSILYGQKGEITVNGQVYNGEQPGFEFTDREAADIMNYIQNSWNNSAEMVTPEQVATERKK